MVLCRVQRSHLLPAARAADYNVLGGVLYIKTSNLDDSRLLRNLLSFGHSVVVASRSNELRIDGAAAPNCC